LDIEVASNTNDLKQISVSIFIKDCNDEKLDRSDLEERCRTNRSGIIEKKSLLKSSITPDNTGNWRCRDYITRRSLLSSQTLLPDDTLTIGCVVTGHRYKLKSGQLSNTGGMTSSKILVDNDMHRQKLSTDYLRLLEQAPFADFKIISSDGKSFPCHRSILSIRSEYFKTMLATQMKETNSKVYEIEDFSSDVIEEMLIFVYTGQTGGGNIMELFKAAHRYLFEDLKSWCECNMANEITDDNVVDNLILADLYGAPELKTAATTFIAKHWGTIKERPDWQKALVEHPHFSTLVLLRI